jgi:hypothetical protein
MAVCYFGTPPARSFLIKDSRISDVTRKRIGGGIDELGNWINDAVGRVAGPATPENEGVDIQPALATTPVSSPGRPSVSPNLVVPVAKPSSAVIASRDKRPERWGVVQEPTAKIYDLNGKFLRRIDAGSCVEFVDIVHSKDGRRLGRARIMPNSSGREILIALDSLDIADGPYGSASEIERRLRVQRARLLGKIVEADRAFARRLNPANPYMRSYSSAKKKYTAFWREVEQLKAAASGPNRAKALDKLRLMKGEDIQVGKAYKKAKADYENWEREHPQSLAADSQMAALQKRLADIDEQLRGLH